MSSLSSRTHSPHSPHLQQPSLPDGAAVMDFLKDSEFPSFTERLVRRNHVPGIAVAVVQDETVASFAYGEASLEGEPRPVSADTIFCVGSAAKSLTAAAVALLVADDRYPHVQWKSTMASILPDDFVMPGSSHDDVTVEDVLCHRTGMAPHEYSIMGVKAAQPDSPRSITRNLRNLSCVTENRAEHVYCNMMYTVATHLVEHVSGMSFGAFLKKRIFEPLRMDSTFLLQDSVHEHGQAHRLAHGYTWSRPDMKQLRLQINDGLEAQGAGQIYSTVHDYLKWVKAMINHEGPITKEIADQLTEQRIEEEPLEEGSDESSKFYALGWRVHKYDGKVIVSHDGGDPGYQCNHFFVPERKLGGVIFTNLDQGDTTVSLLTYKLIDSLTNPIVHDQPHDADDSDSESNPHSGSDSDSDSDDYDFEEELRQELSPGLGKPEEQKLPLGAYTGLYYHPGYHALRVEDKDGVLFIDGRDRSFGFTLTMKHICDQTKYIGYMAQDIEVDDMPTKVEFRLDDNRAVKIGIHLEERLTDYIWFDRVDG